MYIIKGFKKNSGTINQTGKPWENYSLHCLKHENGVTGYATQIIKCSPAVLSETFENPFDMIDKSVNIDFDMRQYGSKTSVVVVAINIVKGEK